MSTDPTPAEAASPAEPAGLDWAELAKITAVLAAAGYSASAVAETVRHPGKYADDVAEARAMHAAPRGTAERRAAADHLAAIAPPPPAPPVETERAATLRAAVDSNAAHQAVVETFHRHDVAGDDQPIAWRAVRAVLDLPLSGLMPTPTPSAAPAAGTGGELATIRDDLYAYAHAPVSPESGGAAP